MNKKSNKITIKIPKMAQKSIFIRKENNIRLSKVGNFTGKCFYCGSKDLWDDNLSYGCNSCGSFLGGN